MPVTYTHTFQIQANSHNIEGEIEFNVDGTMTYKTTDPIENISLAQSRAVDSLFEHCKQIFDEFGGIVKIKIEKKP